MKKLIPILILFISFSAFAQRGEQIEERIKAQKIAFISDKLQLTSEEAQQFWPIYNAFEAKIESIESGDLRLIKQEMRRGNVSDERADELLAKILDAENKMHEAQRSVLRAVTGLLCLWGVCSSLCDFFRLAYFGSTS